MKKNKISAAIFSLALASLALVSCGSSWTTDFDAAKKNAAKSKKNIMVLFSGDDWDTVSADYKKEVFNNPKFISEAQKGNLLVNIDFSQTEYAKVDLKEDADEKAKKEAERIEAEYQKKEKLARECNLSQYPSLYILSEEGFILANIPCTEESKNVDSFLALLEESKEEISKRMEAIKAVRNASGIEKVKAINELYESSDPAYLQPLSALVHEVPSLDPENETGLVGNYILYSAYFDSYELILEDPELAADNFEKIAGNDFLNTDQKQNAYYMAAFMLARGGSDNFDRMESLLQTAYDLDPKGEHAQGLLDAIAATKEMAKAAQTKASEFE